MIYFTTPDQKHVLILQPENIEKMRAGEPLASPDSLVLVAYTPDINWFRDRLIEVFNEPGRTLTVAKLDELLREGLKRPEVNENVPRNPADGQGNVPPIDPGVAPPPVEKA